MMPRDRANLRIDIWADDDWRALSDTAQHLYMLLLSHPTLTYAGVVEWRPGKLAAMSRGKTAEDVIRDGAELEAGRFIVVDSSTEEVLVRSFVKHDGLLKQPKLAVSMANAYAGIASRKIRQALAFEVQKLRNSHPDLRGWGVGQLETILRADAVSASDLGLELTPDFTLELTPPVTLSVTRPVTPELTQGVTPNVGQAQGLRTTTATATTTEASLLTDAKRIPETVLPDSWSPTKAHFEYARDHHLDLMGEAEAFRLHAQTHDRHAARWNAAFATWLRKAKPRPGGVLSRIPEWQR